MTARENVFLAAAKWIGVVVVCAFSMYALVYLSVYAAVAAIGNNN